MAEVRQQLTLGDLHSETDRAQALFRDGHFQEAVRKAAERFLNRVAELADHPKAQDKQGTELINLVFSEKKPILAFSSRETRIERGEHNGYRFLAAGLTLAIRNVMTHADEYDLAEPEAIEWLAFVSAMHRRLDRVQQFATQPAEGSSGADSGDSGADSADTAPA